MKKDVIPTSEQRVALVNEAQQRLEQRARSWLEDRTVKAALRAFDPDDEPVKKAS